MKLNSFTARRGLNPVSLAVGNKVQALTETKPRTPTAVQRTGPTSCKEAWPDKAGWYKVFWAHEAENTDKRSVHFRFIQPGVGCSWGFFTQSPTENFPSVELMGKAPRYFEGASQDTLELFWFPEILAS